MDIEQPQLHNTSHREHEGMEDATEDGAEPHKQGCRCPACKKKERLRRNREYRRQQRAAKSPRRELPTAEQLLAKDRDRKRAKRAQELAHTKCQGCGELGNVRKLHDSILCPACRKINKNERARERMESRRMSQVVANDIHSRAKHKYIAPTFFTTI